MGLVSYFCPACSWHPCRCTDWRAMERQRVDAGTAGRSVSWDCEHGLRDNHPVKGHIPMPGSNGWWFGHRTIWTRRAQKAVA